MTIVPRKKKGEEHVLVREEKEVNTSTLTICDKVEAIDERNGGEINRDLLNSRISHLISKKRPQNFVDSSPVIPLTGPEYRSM
jgi:hypothetical protein